MYRSSFHHRQVQGITNSFEEGKQQAGTPFQIPLHATADWFEHMRLVRRRPYGRVRPSPQCPLDTNGCDQNL